HTLLYPLSLHDALPISAGAVAPVGVAHETSQFDRRLRLVRQHPEQRGNAVHACLLAHGVLRGRPHWVAALGVDCSDGIGNASVRSEEHTSELQSRSDLV